MLGKVALALSVLSVALCATIWLALIGGPLALVALVLGVVAVRRASGAGARSRSGRAAIVLALIAIAIAAFFGVSCSTWLSCV